MQETPVAFVTGASRGIGRCSALALARAGFDVVCTARTLREGEGRVAPSSSRERVDDIAVPGSLESTAADVEALGQRALVLRLDITDRVSIGRGVERALAEWGHVDVLLNNAIYQGPGTMDRFLDLTADRAETMVLSNYVNQLLLTQQVIPSMLERGGGTIVNMVSGSAYNDPPGPAGEGGWGVGYAASKAAFGRLAGVIQAEFGSRGIRAFNLEPGFVITERMKATGGDASFTDAGFRGSPPEVPGAVVAWLATAAAAEPYAGKLVHAQRVCKDHDLLPGWPPA
jgi:NAD(P)-dependent dehydrogenase (short-subunit alcohol dehydrogenase family)